MHTIGRYSWTLLRRFKTKETLLFPVTVDIREDAQARFGARILGLENSLIATGRSPIEAHENALSLFQHRVDYVLDQRQNQPLSEELAGIVFLRMNVPLEEAAEALKTLMTQIREERDVWRLAQTGSAPSPTSQAA